MAHFKYRIGKDVYIVSRIEDIPEEIDNLIEFAPDFPPGPHNDEEHDEMSQFNNQLKMLMRREKACRQQRT